MDGRFLESGDDDEAWISQGGWVSLCDGTLTDDELIHSTNLLLAGDRPYRAPCHVLGPRRGGRGVLCSGKRRVSAMTVIRVDPFSLNHSSH